MVLPVMPTGALNNVVRRPVVAAAVTSSPFTGEQQVQDWGGEWWEYSIDFWPQTGNDGRAIAAFLAALRGPVGTFIFEDPAEANTASVGTPLVDGASQTGSTLITKGWSLSITVLSAGQFIQLGSDSTARLHMVTADAVSDGSGNSTLAIWPALRESPVNSSVIVIDNPGVVLRLTQNVDVDITPHTTYQFSVSAREVI